MKMPPESFLDHLLMAQHNLYVFLYVYYTLRKDNLKKKSLQVIYTLPHKMTYYTHKYTPAVCEKHEVSHKEIKNT